MTRSRRCCPQCLVDFHVAVRHNSAIWAFRGDLWFRNASKLTIPPRRTILCSCVLILMVSAAAVRAQRPGEAPLGVAWQVRGSWQIEGKSTPVITGDAVPPGSLLQPMGEPANHSILIFLPDGQRILYECFLAQDCGRAFRVPLFFASPIPLQWTCWRAFARCCPGVAGTQESRQSQASRLPREETLAALGAGNSVEIGGLAGKLSNGRYTYDLQPLDPGTPRQSQVILEKNAPTITLPLPSPGLYDITVSDQLNTQRIDVFIAAVKSEESAVS